MWLKIIAEIIVGHNYVINHRYPRGYLPPEERFKSNQATQRAIYTTATLTLSLLFAFIRPTLMALSTPVNPASAPLMRRGHDTPRGSFTHRATLRRHLRTTGCQRYRPCKQGQNRNQQYDGV